MIALWLACSGPADTDPLLPDVYRVTVATDPAPPVAGAEATVTLQVLGNDGPVDDLVRIHERMVHTFVIPRDLSSFGHVHHEDFATLTGEDLRAATFHWPYTFPKAGGWWLAFEFATEGEYHTAGASLDVDGAPAQEPAPVVDTRGEVVIDDVRATLVWDDGPNDGASVFTVHLTDATTGDPVTDVVMWLGADAHAALVRDDLSVVTHTHAWVAGMDDMPPGHEMPHQYDGPDLPFHVDTAPGTWKTWVQFARSDGRVYTLPLGFVVP